MVDAGRPNYDDVQGIEDLPEQSGGMFGAYPPVTLDSLLGVPILIEDAKLQDSTINPGEQYVIFAAALSKRKMLTPKADDAEPYQGEIGYLVSASTSSFRVVGKIKAMIERGFDRPYAVMVSKVEGGHAKARTIVPATIDNLPEVIKARQANPRG
jgi:hypothetical protein